MAANLISETPGRCHLSVTQLGVVTSGVGEKKPQEPSTPTKNEQEDIKDNKDVEDKKEVEENGEVEKPNENGDEKQAPEPKDMRAIVLNSFGGIKSVKALRKPEPTLAEGEVLIRVKAW
ncbi:hypothetical protein PV326_005506 [Microctonus aethiopoides]|nr:hypothetical protein PV326_005506 [Microctonus aethiopoides]